MSAINREFVERMFRAFEDKDMEGALRSFAEDALFFDPHYPVPEMGGKSAIREGLEEAFGIIKKPSFVIRHLWTAGPTAAVEVDTHHVLQDGTEIKSPQVFVLEIGQDGLITRLQSYVSHLP